MSKATDLTDEYIQLLKAESVDDKVTTDKVVEVLGCTKHAATTLRDRWAIHFLEAKIKGMVAIKDAKVAITPTHPKRNVLVNDDDTSTPIQVIGEGGRFVKWKLA